jgi:UDP-N-acetylglucosamine diphosphorylase/glucosamine-1-phosphate N-acetyltransferase
MKLILLDVDGERRRNFYPLALCRPLWQLRLGITTLGEKLVAAAGARHVAAFMPDYMLEASRHETPAIDATLNDEAALTDDGLLLVDSLVKAEDCPRLDGPAEVCVGPEDELLYARIPPGTLGAFRPGSISQLIGWARAQLPVATARPVTWDFSWDLIDDNVNVIGRDFYRLAQSGVEGSIESPSTIRGSAADVYIARGATIEPMAVLDATKGPIYIDEGAVIEPFTRIEGPCYVGRGSMLLSARCREGNSIGPMCRIGGEIEHTIVQGYSNMYHYGFLGHAFLGQWVNIGAMTTNSDLRNDYGHVSMRLDERGAIDTGWTKMGSLIGDHAKTSIGTLMNTGAYVGAFSILIAGDRLMPKYTPSFCAYMRGSIAEYFGRTELYDTARIVLGRRGCEWTPQMQAMWDHVYELTAPHREIVAGRMAR